MVFLSLLGYMAGYFFELGYKRRVYRPRGGDLDRFLHYSSKGIVVIFLISIFLIFSGADALILASADNFLPQASQELLLTSFFAYLVLSVILEGIIIFSPIIGWVWKLIKSEFFQTEVTIETNDNKEPIVVSEIYDENADYLFFVDKNENWGLIKKSLVNKISSTTIRPVRRR